MPCVVEDPQLERPPRIRIAPVGCDTSMAEEAISLGDAYIGASYDWQDDVIRGWMATKENEEGQIVYACPTCGLIVPRQNGKTKRCVAKRMLYGAAIKGEQIRYSAHRVDTMLEVFEIFVSLFGDPHIPQEEWPYPEIHSEVKKFVFKNGHERIDFQSGGIIWFVSRSTGAGRGKSIDVNIYDEAQFLTDDQLAASMFAASAAPSRDPQTIYLGTPPSELGVTAETFSRQRENAIARVPGICWHEWSVEEIGDVSDRSRWYATNPSLGKALLLSAVEKELAEATPIKFAIERLCYWPASVSDRVIDAKKWDEAALDKEKTPSNEKFEKLAVGVKFEPGGARVCVSIGAKIKAEPGEVPQAYSELTYDEETFGGIRWLVDWIVAGKGEIACVAIDGKSGGGSLAEELIRAGMPKKAITLMGAPSVVSATTTLVNMTADGQLTHKKDQTLDASAKGATKRRIGDGYGFGGDSCAIESCAAAVWAVLNTKRNPKRKQMVG